MLFLKLIAGISLHYFKADYMEVRKRHHSVTYNQSWRLKRRYWWHCLSCPSNTRELIRH